MSLGSPVFQDLNLLFNSNTIRELDVKSNQVIHSRHTEQKTTVKLQIHYRFEFL